MVKYIGIELPYRETDWSRIRRSIVRNVQILIVSAVRICKQCLQTSASAGTSCPIRNLLYRGFAPEPLWETSFPQTRWATATRMKISDTATMQRTEKYTPYLWKSSKKVVFGPPICRWRGRGDTADFGHAFSNRSYFRPCDQFSLSSV